MCLASKPKARPHVCGYCVKLKSLLRNHMRQKCFEQRRTAGRKTQCRNGQQLLFRDHASQFHNDQTIGIASNSLCSSYNTMGLTPSNEVSGEPLTARKSIASFTDKLISPDMATEQESNGPLLDDSSAHAYFYDANGTVEAANLTHVPTYTNAHFEEWNDANTSHPALFVSAVSRSFDVDVSHTTSANAESEISNYLETYQEAASVIGQSQSSNDVRMPHVAVSVAALAEPPNDVNTSHAAVSVASLAKPPNDVNTSHAAVSVAALAEPSNDVKASHAAGSVTMKSEPTNDAAVAALSKLTVKDYIKTHVRMRTNSVNCKLCPKMLDSKQSLRHHMIRKHPSHWQAHINAKTTAISSENALQARTCDVCYKVYPSQFAMKKHKRIMHHKLYAEKCPICDKLVLEKSHMRQHVLTHQPKQSRATFTCDICKKKYISKKYLQQHLSKKHRDQFGPLDCPESSTGFGAFAVETETPVGHGSMEVVAAVTSKSISNGLVMNLKVDATVEDAATCHHVVNDTDAVADDAATGHRVVEATDAVVDDESMCHRVVETTDAAANDAATCDRVIETTDAAADDAATCPRVVEATDAAADDAATCPRVVEAIDADDAATCHHVIEATDASADNDRVNMKSIGCEHCERKFENENTFRKHMHREHRSHYLTLINAKKKLRTSAEMTLQERTCDICQKVYHNKYAMLEHKKTYHFRLRAARCPVCDKLFLERSHIKDHLLTHQPKKLRATFNCDVCKIEYLREKSWQQHMAKKHGGQVKCDRAMEVGGRVDGDRAANNHSNAPSTSSNAIEITRFSETTGGNFAVPQFATSFKEEANAGNVDLLKDAHTVESVMRADAPADPSADALCTIEELRTAHALKQASLVKCALCDKSYSHKSSLQQHITKEHCPLSENDDVEANSKSTRINTKKERTSDEVTLQERTCDICQKVYHNKNTMLQHKKTYHFKLRAARCPVCDKLFLEKSHIKDHLLTHRPKQLRTTFNCDVCKKEYLKEKNWKQHMAKNHGRQVKCDRSMEVGGRVDGDFTMKTRSQVDGDCSMTNRGQVDGDCTIKTSGQVDGDCAIKTRSQVYGECTMKTRSQVDGDWTMTTAGQVNGDCTIDVRDRVDIGVTVNRHFIPSSTSSKSVEISPSSVTPGGNFTARQVATSLKKEASAGNGEFLKDAHIIDAARLDILPPDVPADAACTIQEMKSAHAKKQARRMKCALCDKSYSHKSTLRLHITRAHCPPSEYDDGKAKKKRTSAEVTLQERTCDICQKVYHNKNTMLQHKKTYHLKMRAASCPVCDKLFLERGHLKDHLLTHRPKQLRTTFKCDVCKKEYLKEKSWKQHMAKKHGGQVKCDRVMEVGDRVDTDRVMEVEGRGNDDAVNVNFMNNAQTTDSAMRDGSRAKVPAVRCTIQELKTAHALKQARMMKCDFCDKSYSRKDSLQQHITKEHCPPSEYGVVKYTRRSRRCKNSSKDDTVEMTSAATKNDNNELSKYICEFCGMSFAKKSVLHHHRHSVHMYNQLGDYPCTVCALRCQTRHELRRHMRVHTMTSEERKQLKRYACDRCGKTFAKQCDLNGHVWRSHTGEKPFKCKQCPFATTQSRLLGQHMIRHTGVRKHKCDTCGKACSTSGQLSKHKKRHEGRYDVTCPICGKRVMDASELKTHLVTHSDERPFACDVCSQAFKRAFTLRQHMKTHNSERGKGHRNVT